MFQGFLPVPTIRHIEKLNTFLAQLKTCYVPTSFTCIDLERAKLLTAADSSLGNADKYSQAGHDVFLTLDTPGQSHLCGYVTLLNFKSGKSKRVASSSMAAEVLQLATAVEDSMFVQSWLYELAHPTLSSLELHQVDPRQFIPCEVCTDCNDAYEVLIKAASPTLSNRSLTLFVFMLREAKQNGSVRSWIWLDTRNMIANGQTKIEENGTLDMELMNKVMSTNFFEPVHPYKKDGIMMSPADRKAIRIASIR